MDIKISLPKPNDTSGQKIKSFLRKMELVVHHLKKQIEEEESSNGKLSENTYIMYSFPFLERQYNKGKDITEVHIDDTADGLQEIEIEINTI